MISEEEKGKENSLRSPFWAIIKISKLEPVNQLLHVCWPYSPSSPPQPPFRGGKLMPADNEIDEKSVEQGSYLLQGHYMVPEVPSKQKGARTCQP